MNRKDCHAVLQYGGSVKYVTRDRKEGGAGTQVTPNQVQPYVDRESIGMTIHQSHETGSDLNTSCEHDGFGLSSA